MSMNGKITLVSNKGTGSSRVCQIANGMTAQEVLHAELGLEDPEKYLILVQGKPVKKPSSHVLKDGDFVIIVPTNVKGA